jgi:diaminohydroxyphosphoribosylaminopyrimidine deaminase/5-amino-6-(5-phosphoribosylamino)uracil reductase
MEMALELAEGGFGRVAPNPLVGAVLVNGGRIVGTGFHPAFGQPHAEIGAIRAAGDQARGGTLFVSLEPCRHHGKTPPCTDAIIEAGIARIVYGTRDRHPAARGGIEVLSAAGIQVEGPVLEGRCSELNAPFFKHVATGRPLVLAKWAMTLDGKLASSTGESRWISSDASRKLAHHWRGRCGGLLVGIGTALSDNPSLSCLAEGLPSPVKIVLDAECRLKPDARVFEPHRDSGEPPRVLVYAAETAPAGRVEALQARGAEVVRVGSSRGLVSISATLDDLGRRGINHLMVEGGSEVLGAFFDSGFIDQILVFVAPKLVGGRSAKSPLGGDGLARMLDAPILRELRNYRLEGDLVVEGKLGGWDWMNQPDA